MAKRSLLSKMLLTIVLTLVFMTSLFVVPQSAYANSDIFLDVKNSSFENLGVDEFYKQLPTDWSIIESFEPENVKVVSTNAYHRANYWQFEGGAYTVENDGYIEIENNTDYLFGVKFIFSNANDSLTFNIKTFDENGELIEACQGQTVVSSEELKNTWQETFLVLNKDSRVKKVKISIAIVAQAGSVGIDNVYGRENFFSLYDGASISLERNVIGIRFTAKIDAKIYQALKDKYTAVSAGLIISPKSQVIESGEFTIKGVVDTDKIIVVPATYWNNSSSAEQDGYYTFYCAFYSNGYDSLQNIDINFTARAYIKYIKGGEEQILYSSWSLENNCRSIRQVATMAKEDIDVFNSYDLDQQEIITAFSEGKAPNFDGLD